MVKKTVKDPFFGEITLDDEEYVADEYWWTESFRTGEVRSRSARIGTALFYALYVTYLCLRGVPIMVRLRRKMGHTKIRFE